MRNLWLLINCDYLPSFSSLLNLSVYYNIICGRFTAKGVTKTVNADITSFILGPCSSDSVCSMGRGRSVSNTGSC